MALNLSIVWNIKDTILCLMNRANMMDFHHPSEVVVQFWLKPGDEGVELSFSGGGSGSTPGVLEGMF